MTTPAVVTAHPWTDRRRRAETLRGRYPFAADVLALYGALTDVQERVYLAVQADPPEPRLVPAYAAELVVPVVVDATMIHGPDALSRAIRERARPSDSARAITAWLAGAELTPVERYLARAAAGPVLEALGPRAGAACAGSRDERHCPVCGGPPQVSYLAASADALVAGHRYLVCSRCAASWPYPRMTCAACGEHAAAKLPVYAEEGTAAAETSGHVVRGVAASRFDGPGNAASGAVARFPHIRVEACETCSRYLLGIDLTRDPQAVPIVDEMAALPLDLYAQDRGMTKIVPNLMGV
jgi:Protein involved in formate dehydrogenase formation